jgi:diketogulonate reductase-like aldo/keto reductase
MKSIYLTEQAKQEIEAKIKQLVIKSEKQYKEGLTHSWSVTQGKIHSLKEILESATVLPAVESWELAVDRETILTVHYPNGIIIQPK